MPCKQTSPNGAPADHESRSLERRLPKLEVDVFEVNTKIQEELAPKLRAARTSYAELADKRGEVREALGLYQSLKDLEDRRTGARTGRG